MNKRKFIEQVREILASGERVSRPKIEKLAQSFGIDNKNLVKEYTELAIVFNAREVAQNTTLSTFEKYNRIVELYESQVNLSLRTSMSVLMQQYSTPAPISFLASNYIKQKNTNAEYLEPSAGNGLLTIALPYTQTHVNELDEVRLENLKDQPFAKVTSWNGLEPPRAYQKKFDGIITNPPFATLSEPIQFGVFKIKRLEHAMCIRALQCLKDNGKAALIIGGHTTWDEKGRVNAGHNRIFLNYLYHFYHVEDVIAIDGKKLYSRQGTSFNTRLILIDGVKDKPEGAAPLRNNLHESIVRTHQALWDRVGIKESVQNDSNLLRLKAKAIRLKQKQLELENTENV